MSYVPHPVTFSTTDVTEPVACIFLTTIGVIIYALLRNGFSLKSFAATFNLPYGEIETNEKGPSMKETLRNMRGRGAGIMDLFLQVLWILLTITLFITSFTGYFLNAPASSGAYAWRWPMDTWNFIGLSISMVVVLMYDLIKMTLMFEKPMCGISPSKINAVLWFMNVFFMFCFISVMLGITFAWDFNGSVGTPNTWTTYVVKALNVSASSLQLVYLASFLIMFYDRLPESGKSENAPNLAYTPIPNAFKFAGFGAYPLGQRIPSIGMAPFQSMTIGFCFAFALNFFVSSLQLYHDQLLATNAFFTILFPTILFVFNSRSQNYFIPMFFQSFLLATGWAYFFYWTQMTNTNVADWCLAVANPDSTQASNFLSTLFMPLMSGFNAAISIAVLLSLYMTRAEVGLMFSSGI